MGALKLESCILNSAKPKSKNTCVVDYIWSQGRGKGGFKTYTGNNEKLSNELKNYAVNFSMNSTEDIVDWRMQI